MEKAVNDCYRSGFGSLEIVKDEQYFTLFGRLKRNGSVSTFFRSAGQTWKAGTHYS